MERIFVCPDNFEKMWSSLRLGPEELRELEIQLLMDPRKGDVIEKTGGLRKLRFSPETVNKGKSGSYRIIYLDIPRSSHLIFLVVYPKSKKDTLTDDEKKRLRSFVGHLKQQYASLKEE